MARHYIERESGAVLVQRDLQSTLGFNAAIGRRNPGDTGHSSFMRPVCQTIKVVMYTAPYIVVCLSIGLI